MTLPPTDKTPAGESVIWLHHDPAIALLEVIAWLAYPRADRAAKAFDRLTWWPVAQRGHTVPEKPSRLLERLAAIDSRLRERLVAGGLLAAKARRYHRSQPPWNDLKLQPEMARTVAALEAAMDAANPPGTLEMLRRVNGIQAAGDRTWQRKLTAESRPVAHLAAAWVEHSSVRFGMTLREAVFATRPAGELAAILRNAETLRARIAADPTNKIGAGSMLQFAQRPVSDAA